MARIGDIQEAVTDRNTAVGNFSNEKEVWRNTCRLRHNEEWTAVRFIQDLEDGDKTLFHTFSGTSNTGTPFTSYRFCNENRQNFLEGKPLIEGPCVHCEQLRTDNVDPQEIQMRNRYRYWVFQYAIFHVENNPDIRDQREWTKDWKAVEVGRQIYYRERKMQPQILELSPGTWDDLKADYDRRGTITDRTYEYRRTFRESQVRYKLVSSDIKVPDVSARLDPIIETLPLMRDVAAEIVTEVDLPVFERESKADEIKTTDDAFQRMANIAEGELE
jgi:hypothetical protein